MQKDLRATFNAQFDEAKYQAYLQQIEALHPGALDFRVAETPLFIPQDFTRKMLSACDDILDVITADNFTKLTDRSIPQNLRVPGNEAHAQCLVFDFGICENARGALEPQLIEMQGFPSLFGFQAYHTALTAAYANVPKTHSAYLNGYDRESYIALLKEIIVGTHNPDNVILLEILPEQQKTRIDFYCTEK
ncbi:MAG: hypothetical protein EOO03_17265, partial [Chitinophagaceae bacterium]